MQGIFRVDAPCGPPTTFGISHSRYRTVTALSLLAFPRQGQIPAVSSSPLSDLCAR